MIFILGAKGFVGSAFVRYCQRHKLEYVAISRDNYSNYKSQKCKLFINAAGNSSKRLALTEPLQDFDLNVRGTLCSLLDFISSQYIYLSTIDVYNNCSNPNHNAEYNPIIPSRLSRYGLNKYLGELLVQKYARDFLIIRLGGMVGPGLRKNAIYDLTHGGKLFVHPESAYQYIHTDEVSRIVMQLISAHSSGGIINLCGDGMIPLYQVQSCLGLSMSENNLLTERYEININKLKSLISVPTSKSALRQYCQEICVDIQMEDG